MALLKEEIMLISRICLGSPFHILPWIDDGNQNQGRSDHAGGLDSRLDCPFIAQTLVK